MDAYNPFNAPDPVAWDSLDEAERIELVREYHVQAGETPPDPQMHAMVHVVVESQVAIGDEIPVRANLERLMRQGLDRHDAIHAIGGVVFAHMNDLASGADLRPPPNKGLFKTLKKLNADAWLASFE